MGGWGSFVVSRRRTVLVVVLVAVFLSGLFGLGVFDRLSLGGYNDPNSQSAEVDRLMTESVGRDSADLTITFRPTDGRSIDEVEGVVSERLAQIDDDWLAGPPLTYWTAPAFTQQALRSADGSTALAAFSLFGNENDRLHLVPRIQELLQFDGIETQYGGYSVIEDAYNQQSKRDLVMAESMSFPLLMILLLVFFGGLVAASMPLVIGGLSALGALAWLHVLSYFTEVSSFAVNIATLIGLGMAVDYSLFIVSRFREEVRAGHDTRSAVERTVATAGRTIRYSSLLLICGFLGLLAFPQAFVRSFGYGGIGAVAVAATISMTALPAALAILGPRIDAWSWRPGSLRRGEERSFRFWTRVASRSMRRPVVTVTLILGALAFVSVPALGTQLGDLSVDGLPADNPARVVVEETQKDFPLANNGATILVRATDGGTPSPSEGAAVADAANGVDGVAAAFVTNTTPEFTVVKAIFDSPDRSESAYGTVEGLRDLSTPEGTELLLGGITALSADGLDSIAGAIPVMIAIMVLATLVILFAAFRSVVLPFKAVFMATVSLSATFGILTWLFQHGHGSGIFGVDAGPLLATMVIVILALIFGLSTDYEIFLMSRMLEAKERGASNEAAILEGAGRTGRIITAAALLLLVVTGAFAISDLSMMRFVGIGMIIALVIDATVVRMALVPALMKLMGNANWWGPAAFARKRPPLTGIGPQQAEPDSSKHSLPTH
ncbi:MMPL family transporter [Rhodococcus sp. NPDC058521]|uniref:MMPL family transporter n=1 Tax=Rhodococcus sp. NPDC058521 TaxID=3346536 RepID=UPI00366A33EC